MKCQDKCCWNCVCSAICDEWRTVKPEIEELKIVKELSKYIPGDAIQKPEH